MKKIVIAIIALSCFVACKQSHKQQEEVKAEVKAPEKTKQLVDFFRPMEPQGKLVSEGIWGAENVLPRDTMNGLEDAKLKNWCYWDGRIVKSDDGRFHIYGSRWTHTVSHSKGWHVESKGIHAVSNHIMGPYEDKGMIWPNWKNGLGHNVIGLRMHDGRYAVVTSEVTPGEIFVSDSPDGPFELLGQIKVDLNGYPQELAMYDENNAGAVKNNFVGHMSNVKVMLRPDGRYMIIPRSTAPMISENGILGPYKVMGDRIFIKDFPDYNVWHMEDPTVWYSGGIYHIVVNHWPTKTSHHYTSKDGISDWTYRGIAFKKDAKIFKYTNGTTNDWMFVERPTAYVEDGHVTHFIFSVIDVKKGQDKANDNHASKIVVVPFDGVAFDEHMQSVIQSED